MDFGWEQVGIENDSCTFVVGFPFVGFEVLENRRKEEHGSRGSIYIVGLQQKFESGRHL